MPKPKTLKMPIWAGFRAGAHNEPCDGTIEVDFHGSRATQRQLDAVAATQKRAKAMQPKVLDALLQAYPKLEKLHPVLQRSHGLKKKPEKMTKAAMKSHFALWEILVTSDHHDDVAYVSYNFATSWHPSGTHVLTHGDRIVAVGDSEVLTYPHADPERQPAKPTGPTPAKVNALREAAKKRAAKNPSTLRAGSEEMTIYLPAWAGFVARAGAAPSNGEVMVDVGGDAREDTALGPAQHAAYRSLLRDAVKVQKNMLAAIALAHPKHAPLETHVELTSIHIHGASAAGVAIVGYELACAWDTEHGLGVLVHGDRVLKIGGADVAILRWMADAAAKKAKRSKG
jgi:hypothetical protein